MLLRVGILIALVFGLVGWIRPGVAEPTCRSNEHLLLVQEKALASPKPPEQALKLPEWWRATDPLPIEKTNCVRCHLTAGRELTAPLRDFARSIHDFAKLSCNDCHGGNTKNDATAHESEHGFIGTKLSAHMAVCTACHERETLGFRKGKHFWDLTKSINRKYPACVDCHGNHDIGKPPAEFAMANVCTDCHKDFAKQMPELAAVVSENDALWKTLRKVQAKNTNASEPIPESFRRDRERVRALAGRLLHRAGPITQEEAKQLNEQSHKLRDGLENWLSQQK
jgi:hypothetical protein